MEDLLKTLPAAAILPVLAAIYQTRQLEKRTAELAEANRMLVEMAKELSNTRAVLQRLHEKHESSSSQLTPV